MSAIETIHKIARQIEDGERQALANASQPGRRRVYPMPDHYWAVYHYIIEYKAANDGNSPTIRELMTAFPLVTSTCSMSWILRRLQVEGLIKRKKGERSITVIGGKWVPPEGAR